MNSINGGQKQKGVALVVALLFLLVVTIISVVAASNSSMSLKMAANMQDSYSSFQAAEAGVVAALAQAGTSNDPFMGEDDLTPFDAFIAADHPLRDVFGGEGTIDADVILTSSALACPRVASASSVSLFECDYYRVSSEHVVARRARTKVQLGVVKTVIGGSSL